MRQPALVALRLVSRIRVKDVASISTLSRSPAFLFRKDFGPRRRAFDASSIGAPASAGFRTVLRSSTSSAKDDDYDDWYADFDPSEWESVADTALDDDYQSRHKRTSSRPHDYIRDVSVDNSNVDVSAIDSLLSERLEAKKMRRFDVADQIRDDLLDNYGVVVWDKEKTWRTGCSRSGSGMRRPGNRRKQSGSTRRRDRDFGPLGHDYLECEESSGTYLSPLSDEAMHKLIAERLQCKLSRDFQRADEIQSMLAENGVFLHDGRKEWRADAVPFGDLYTGNSPKPGRERGSRTALGPNGHDYDPAPDAGPNASALSEEKIHSLIAERLQCKMNRNFLEADNIQAELIRNGVYIHDKKKLWRADGEPFEDFSVRRGERRKDDGVDVYSKSKFSRSLSPEDTETVVRMVGLRAAARGKRDYGTADDIQDELRLDWDIEIDDKKREWSAGGDFGREQEVPRSRQWIRRGSGNLSDSDIATVTSLLDERMKAKKARNFVVADAIRNELRDTYSVSVDDFAFEWRVLSDEYVPVGSPQLDADTVSYIQESLARRLVAKQDRDYDIADRIREDLRETHSVVIDDRTREWKIDDLSSEVMAVEDSSDDDLDAELEAILENKNTCDESEPQIDEDFERMTVPQLKEKLRSVGLPVSGRKADLIDRLTNKGK